MADPILVDAHMHITESREKGRIRKQTYEIWEYGPKTDVRYSAYDGVVEDALDAMNEAGFSKAVVVNLFGSGSPAFERGPALADELKAFNRWGCDTAAPHDGLVPYINVDPHIFSGDEMSAHIRDMVENHGAGGVKLHPVLQRFELGDPRMAPAYRTCIDLGIPVLSHSGPARDGSAFGTPKAFAPLLENFPDLTVVIAHLGGGAWTEALEVAEAFPHAYFDCCEIMEWLGGSSAPTYEQLGRLIKDIGPERVVMGSDFPWYDLDRSVEIVMGLPHLAREEKEAMLGANAVRIMGL